MSSAPLIVKDVQTTTPTGERLLKLPEGTRIRDLTTHIDERGAVCEMFDQRWNFTNDPIVAYHMFTVRPGFVKGWGMHKSHEDRYCLLLGELKVVLYDDRPESPTYKLVAEVFMSEYRRQLLQIPRGVWHANQNIGSKDVLVVDAPTRPYDHENPDKYRLPIDTDYIPYRFEGVRGW